MPPVGIAPGRREKMIAGRRHGQFDRIADPLWHAIFEGRRDDALRLMAQLKTLVLRDKDRREHPEYYGSDSQRLKSAPKIVDHGWEAFQVQEEPEVSTPTI